MSAWTEVGSCATNESLSRKVLMDGQTGGVRLLLLLLLLVLTERGGWGVKTARREIRHESMKCTTKTKKAEMAVDVAGMGGG